MKVPKQFNLMVKYDVFLFYDNNKIRGLIFSHDSLWNKP